MIFIIEKNLIKKTMALNSYVNISSESSAVKKKKKQHLTAYF